MIFFKLPTSPLCKYNTWNVSFVLLSETEVSHNTSDPFMPLFSTLLTCSHKAFPPALTFAMQRYNVGTHHTTAGQGAHFPVSLMLHQCLPVRTQCARQLMPGQHAMSRCQLQTSPFSQSSRTVRSTAEAVWAGRVTRCLPVRLNTKAHGFIYWTEVNFKVHLKRTCNTVLFIGPGSWFKWIKILKMLG